MSDTIIDFPKVAQSDVGIKINEAISQLPAKGKTP